MRLKLNDCVGSRHQWNVRCLAVLRCMCECGADSLHSAKELQNKNENAVLRNLFYLNSDRQQNNMHTHTIHWNRYVRMCIQNIKFMDLALPRFAHVFAMQHAYKDPN